MESRVIQCVIFDCDGTLVDSEHLSALALELRLRACGVQETAADLLHAYKGWKLAEICRLLEAKHSVRLPESFVPDYRALLEKLFAEQLQPIPGIVQALSEIRLPKCVASSGPPEKIDQSLTLTSLKHYFGEHIFSSYVVHSWKPDPGLFLHAAQAMGFAPEACAVVEDSEVGIRAALNAGMRALWFTGPDDPRLFPDVPRFADMRELPGLLGSGMAN